jgi:hypothetical protein
MAVAGKGKKKKKKKSDVGSRRGVDISSSGGANQFSASMSAGQEDIEASVSKSLTSLADLPLPSKAQKPVVWDDGGFEDDWDLDDADKNSQEREKSRGDNTPTPDPSIETK